MVFSRATLAKTILGLGAIVGCWAAVSHSQTPAVPEAVTSTLTVQQNHLKAIAVRVMNGNLGIGSGTIISVDRGVYLVITNRHVLPAKRQSLAVQTVDRQVHPVKVTEPANSLDLAILEFSAGNNIYATAQRATASPKIGETVMAAGFPQITASEPQPTAQLDSGTISGFPPKPLANGYQIAHSMNILKGMSGGPLLNTQGQLVGINGLHSQPLWDATETYEDGAEVEEPLQSQISNSSWAIPVQRLSALGF
jgi:S1-C subfamily serine protease